MVRGLDLSVIYSESNQNPVLIWLDICAREKTGKDDGTAPLISPYADSQKLTSVASSEGQTSVECVECVVLQ
jgi:hypothetical protein